MMMKLVVCALICCVALAEHPSPGAVVDVTDQNVDQVLNGELPTVVEFYATWCPHCKKFKGEYDHLATNVGKDFIVARVDGEKYDSLADKFQISGYPTVKLLRKGVSAKDPTKAEEYEGAMRENALESWLKSNADSSTATQQHIEMTHLQPELENLIAVPERCYRSERSLYVGV